MKVVLKQNVENVGSAGETRDVSDGFARNFLIPNGLAEIASRENVARATEIAKKEKQKEKKELENTQKLAEKINGSEVLFQVKTEGNKLFGSIDQQQICEKLKEKGVVMSTSNVELDQPIKELGEFPVKIKFNHGLEADIKVIVEKE